MMSWLPTEDVRMRFIISAVEDLCMSDGVYMAVDRHTGGQEICHRRQNEECLDKRIDARSSIHLQVFHHDRSRERDIVSYD